VLCIKKKLNFAPLYKFNNIKYFSSMGKGDQKTKKGKRVRGSYGKTRPRNPVKTPLEQIKKHVENDESPTKVTGEKE
jgi:30S ribosomal protein S31